MLQNFKNILKYKDDAIFQVKNLPSTKLFMIDQFEDWDDKPITYNLSIKDLLYHIKKNKLYDVMVKVSSENDNDGNTVFILTAKTLPFAKHHLSIHVYLTVDESKTEWIEKYTDFDNPTNIEKRTLYRKGYSYKEVEGDEFNILEF